MKLVLLNYREPAWASEKETVNKEREYEVGMKEGNERLLCVIEGERKVGWWWW